MGGWRWRHHSARQWGTLAGGHKSYAVHAARYLHAVCFRGLGRWRPGNHPAFHPRRVGSVPLMTTAACRSRCDVGRERWQVTARSKSKRQSLSDAARQAGAESATRAAARVAAAALPAMSPLPHVGGLFGLEHHTRWGALVKRGLYRGVLVIATAVLVYAIVWLQSKVGQSFATYNVAQRAIQWAELIWLAPVPLGVVLWIGWFVFAEPKQPRMVSVPQVPIGAAPRARRPLRLVLRYVTRGDNVAVLRQSLASARTAFASYSGVAGEYVLEVVTERHLSLEPDVRVVVVPPEYVTPAKSRYKARALSFLQSQADTRPEDWLVYLDEESGISAYLIAGIYEFVARHLAHNTSVPRLIGQGGILYQGGHWFFRGADALRTSDDFGRFRIQYALGMPLFGIHGSYIVTPALADGEISFDVGYDNSITEDAAWALRAWSKGWRFGWVRGCVHEQPPQHALDFIRQRARWLSGIRLVLRDPVVPLRFRACLGIFTALWQLSFLPFLVSALSLIYHVRPFAWIRIPAGFARAGLCLAHLLVDHLHTT